MRAIAQKSFSLPANGVSRARAKVQAATRQSRADLSRASSWLSMLSGEWNTVVAQPKTDDELGPVDFIAVEFPGGRLTAAGFEKLLSIADQGVVKILDMEFITKDADGKCKKADAREFSVPDGIDLSAWAGASSGLLDDADIGLISDAMQPGDVTVVVIYENRWVLALADAWRNDGARLIADGGISADELVTALDATEPS
jgi:hypothetical protein